MIQVFRNNLSAVTPVGCKLVVFYALVLASAGSVSTAVLAQVTDAQGISVGETELVPSLRLSYISTDNLFGTNSNEVSATGFSIQPSVTWKAQQKLLKVEASYDGDYSFYSEDEADFDDHNLRLNAAADISSKQRFVGGLTLSFGHEEFGTGQASFFSDQQDEQVEFTTLIGRLGYEYGARNAKGNIRVGLSVGAVNFSNFEELTDGDDSSFIRPFSIFSLRLSPDTRLLAEVRLGSLDFDDNRRDRNEVEFLTGIETSSSGKLGGNALVGVLRADFDEQSSDDTTELIAEIGLYYLPVSHSRFDLTYDRRLETLDDSQNDAGRSVRDNANLRWTHDWSSRYQTRSNVNFINIDRECAGVDEQTLGVGLEFNFKVRRWLQIGIEGSTASRDVTPCDDQPNEADSLDDDRTMVGVHLRGSL